MNKANNRAEEKSCMFQYAVGHRFINNEILQDTNLITLAQAKKLWNEYLPDFISRRENNEGDPEMVIWINCDNNTDYGDSLERIDFESVIEGGKLYAIKKREIKAFEETK